MSRREFEQVVAQAPKMKLKSVDFSSAIGGFIINAGQTVTVDFYSLSATIGEVRTPLFFAPPPVGATTGTHVLYFSTDLGNLTWKPTYLTATATYNTNISFEAGAVQEANGFVHPNTQEAQQGSISSAVFDSTRAWRISYKNATNANQGSGNLKCSLIYVESEIR